MLQLRSALNKLFSTLDYHTEPLSRNVGLCITAVEKTVPPELKFIFLWRSAACLLE